MGAGRNRSFEKDEALAKAMWVFWAKGYEGTSFSCLKEAIGINKPSLYAVFGNKEKLFISALKHYILKYSEEHFGKLSAQNQDIQSRIRTYLISISEMVSDPNLPGGCFFTNSTCEARNGCLPDDAVHTISMINDEATAKLIEIFQHEQALGNISGASPEILADIVLTLQFGLAVMARSGVQQSRLEFVINQIVIDL